MLRVVAKLSSRASSSSTALTAKPIPTRLSPLPASLFRPFTNGLELDASMTVPDAIRMINYALRQWRSERSQTLFLGDPFVLFGPIGAFRLGLTVLKHCITTELTEGKDPTRENSKGMALLAMSTLLYERGECSEAIEKLDGVQELTNSYLGVRVAALETQAGLHLELRQDDLAVAVADKCMELVENQQQARDFEAQFVRAKALKGLIELVNGNVDSGCAQGSFLLLMSAYYVLGAAEDFFDKSLREKYCDGIFLFMRHCSCLAGILRHRVDIWFCRYCWSIICRIPT
ncbi:hypothetical protein CR513_60223, partial [Mucuna pruriens]